MQKATRQQSKDHNTRLVLRTIYQQGEISRADIARATGLTRPTVSRIVAELNHDHFVVETGLGPSAGGKRPTMIDVAQDEHQVLAIDLGSREFRGAVVNLRGEIVERLTLATREKTGELALALVYELLDTLSAAATAPILGIGVGTPGLTNPQDGVIRAALNLGWSQLPLGDLLAKRYDVPIYVANDSHIAALGEITFGSAAGADNLLVIKIGQGIGSGAVLNGQPFYGDGYGAGEIGHVVVDEGGSLCSCGNYGCLETTSSTRAILGAMSEEAQRHPDSPPVMTDEIAWESAVAALSAGDPAAKRTVEKAGRFLGVAIANLIAPFNIHLIVIAGRVYQLGETFLNSAMREACRRALPSMVADTSIRYSELGNDVVLLGSSAMVLKNELGIV